MRPVKREFSAGGIVVNKKGQILLIQNESVMDHGINYWGFPKGHIEEGQTTKEAALSKYVYVRNGEKIFKIVTIYLMKYLSGNPKDHDHEVIEAKWFTQEEALTTLSFKRDKDILEKTLPFIGSKDKPD